MPTIEHDFNVLMAGLEILHEELAIHAVEGLLGARQAQTACRKSKPHGREGRCSGTDQKDRGAPRASRPQHADAAIGSDALAMPARTQVRHWAAAVRLNAVCRPCRGTEFGSGSRGGTTVPAMRCPVKLPVNVVPARPATRRSQQRLMSRQSGETCGYESARTTESIGKTTDAALLLPPARWP